MFTGLVMATGMVAGTEGGRLRVEIQPPIELTRGSSVAVNGVCLTVVKWTTAASQVDVMDETCEAAHSAT